MVNKKFVHQKIFNKNELPIIRCTFITCNSNSDTKRRGAIKSLFGYKGFVTVYSSTFENCKANNGDDGAIIVYGNEQDTDYDYVCICKFN